MSHMPKWHVLGSRILLPALQYPKDENDPTNEWLNGYYLTFSKSLPTPRFHTSPLTASVYGFLTSALCCFRSPWDVT